MNKIDALKEVSQIENRLKELRKIIEQPDNITDRVATLEEAKAILGIKDDCFSTNKHSKRALAFQNLCIVIVGIQVLNLKKQSLVSTILLKCMMRILKLRK